MHERQFALIGSTLLDVEHAYRLLRATPRRTVQIDVATWARFYGFDGDPNSPIRVGPLFDPSHAMSADLTRPVMLATFASGAAPDEDLLLIIDGSHRLYRAFGEGRAVLPAHVLTADETLAITRTTQLGATP